MFYISPDFKVKQNCTEILSLFSNIVINNIGIVIYKHMYMNKGNNYIIVSVLEKRNIKVKSRNPKS